MADSCARDVRQSATHRELITYVIEQRPSCQQRLSCELTQVLTLRGAVCSATKGRPSTRRTTVTRCNLCARSDLSPMFPAAR